MNFPTSAGWWVGPAGQRPAWDRPGPPPPFNVPADLMGQVPGTPSYPIPLDAGCACQPRAEGGAAPLSYQRSMQPSTELRALGAALLCLAHGGVPDAYGQDAGNDVVFGYLGMPFVSLEPAEIDAVISANAAAGAEAVAVALWQMMARRNPAIVERGRGAYRWDGLSLPPPRVVTLTNALAIGLGLDPLPPGVGSGPRFNQTAIAVHDRLAARGVNDATIAQVIDELGGGNPYFIARELVELAQGSPGLPDPGPEVPCDLVTQVPGAGQDVTAVMHVPDIPPPPPPDEEREGAPWGWIAGGVGVLALVGGAIYFGTRGTKRRRGGARRRRNPHRADVVYVKRRNPPETATACLVMPGGVGWPPVAVNPSKRKASKRAKAKAKPSKRKASKGLRTVQIVTTTTKRKNAKANPSSLKVKGLQRSVLAITSHAWDRTQGQISRPEDAAHFADPEQVRALRALEKRGFVRVWKGSTSTAGHRDYWALPTLAGRVAYQNPKRRKNYGGGFDPQLVALDAPLGGPFYR